MRPEKSKAILYLKLLVGGNSFRSTESITTVHRDTILDLLKVVGTCCEQVMNEHIHSIAIERIEVEEIWGVMGKKEGHKEDVAKSNTKLGDAYTFVLIEAESRLVACFVLGRRDLPTATKFMQKVQKAARKRFQLPTEGLKSYIGAVEQVFGAKIGLAQLVKSYHSDETGNITRRYSPGDFVSAVKVPIVGNPEIENVSTSYKERQSLIMRMSMRRLTGLTNAFSKKWENLEKALAIHFVYYNFCRVH